MENNELIETKKFHINKNIILIAIIAILIIVAIILFIVLKKPKIATKEFGMQRFNNSDQSVSLEIPGEFEFNIQHLDDYELSVNSNKYSSSIFISKVTSVNLRDFEKYVNADKTDYISKFSNISNVSDVTATTVCGNEAYTYHFDYSSNMYVEVYLVLKDKQLYIIDFNLNKDKEDLMNYLPELLNSVII